MKNQSKYQKQYQKPGKYKVIQKRKNLNKQQNEKKLIAEREKYKKKISTRNRNALMINQQDIEKCDFIKCCKNCLIMYKKYKLHIIHMLYYFFLAVYVLKFK